MDRRDYDTEGSVTELFVRMKQGDDSAAEEFWEVMAPRLLRVAQARMSPAIAGKLDPADAVQSAFLSFWKRAKSGGFAGELRTNNLWNLLRTVLVRKLGKKYRGIAAQKRGADQERNESALAGAGEESRILSQLPGNAAEPEVRLRLMELLDKLDEECRTIVAMRLAGYTNAEIAAILCCTERKIERKLQLVRMKWHDDFEPAE